MERPNHGGKFKNRSDAVYMILKAAGSRRRRDARKIIPRCLFAFSLACVLDFVNSPKGQPIKLVWKHKGRLDFLHTICFPTTVPLTWNTVFQRGHQGIQLHVVSKEEERHITNGKCQDSGVQGQFNRSSLLREMTVRVHDSLDIRKVNHFPGMSEICRKDLLARNLNRMLKFFPKDYNFFPKTWCLPADLGEVLAYSRCHRNRTFILKPDIGCRGRGIFLTKNLKDVKPFERMICQVYISKDGYYPFDYV
ncbi:hypothetical protein J6590_054022 [Homalodisca vitripennis]|nr:hypothetical protein J6590_054022 [Homalodisca vitripennis]